MINNCSSSEDVAFISADIKAASKWGGYEVFARFHSRSATAQSGSRNNPSLHSGPPFPLQRPHFPKHGSVSAPTPATVSPPWPWRELCITNYIHPLHDISRGQFAPSGSARPAPESRTDECPRGNRLTTDHNKCHHNVFVITTICNY